VIRYFLKSLGAHFRSGRTLFLLSVLGVALGVASVLSIQIINLNALGAFEGSVKAISGEADFSVFPRTPTLPETAYAEVIAERGVASAWPVYRVDVALDGQDRFFLEVLGLDLFAPMRVPWDEPPEQSGDPLSAPGWTAVSSALAGQFGWTTGSRFEVTSGSRRVSLRVGALVDYQSITPLANSRMVVMDIAQAQHLFGLRGRIHQIDVRLHEDADPGDVKTRLATRLGSTVQVRTPEQRKQEAAGLLGAFRLNLTALSLISLFVGAFLVYTSTQASLVRRRNEFGLLRSVGATRAQIFGIVLAEVVLLGFIGVAVGLPLGYAVAAYNVDVVSATLSNLYLLEEIETLTLPAWMFALAALIGIGGATAGALLPTLDMSRRQTRALLAAYTLHETAARQAGPLFAAGCALIAGTFVGYLALGRDWRPGGFVVGVALLIGLPLLAPWLVKQGTSRLRPGRFGLLYGVKALGLRLQTTAFAVAALAVAVSMLVGITLMIGSFRRTVEIWVESTLRADVYITTESWRRARQPATIDAELIGDLQAYPGVAEMDRLRQFFGYSGDRRVSLVGVDMSLAAKRARFELLEGELSEALARARDSDAVMISEPLARKAGLSVGDTLEVFAPGGVVSFPIVGVSYDYSNEAGGAAMDLDTMERFFGPGPINNVALYLDPGIDPQRTIDSLRARFAERPLHIRSNADLREEIFRIFDQTFAVTRLLQVMSLLIAACGITLTLIVLARERISELALYRALGARRAQIFRVFLGKGMGIALFGIALGGVGGIALAMILIHLINRAYFGWTIAVHWPWAALADQIATILAAAVLASVYPALRASHTPAKELTRENL
jgi:putative ABC transport system permease protein